MILIFEAFWYNNVVLELYQEQTKLVKISNKNYYFNILLQILLAFNFTYLYCLLKQANKHLNLIVIGLLIGSITALAQLNLYPILNDNIALMFLLALANLLIGLLSAISFKIIFR
ncbi:MAG: hypothetical protein ACO2XZ_04605 [Rickettsiales bacterium]